MKGISTLLIFLAFSLQAQITQNASPVSGAYAIVSRTPNSRVWQQPFVTTNVDGTISTNIAAYTEVRSGLCRVDSTTGALVDSSDQIDLVAEGAQAVHG